MKISGFLFLIMILLLDPSVSAENIGKYEVFEMVFRGSDYGTKDNPVRDVELLTRWQNNLSGRIIPV